MFNLFTFNCIEMDTCVQIYEEIHISQFYYMHMDTVEQKWLL